MNDLNGNGYVNFGDDVEWFRFCLDGNGGLYYYHGPAGQQTANSPPAGSVYLPSTVACGQPIEVTYPKTLSIKPGWEKLAGQAGARVLPYAGATIFDRTARGNWLNIGFSVVSTGTIPTSGMIDTSKADTTTGIEILASSQAGLSW